MAPKRKLIVCCDGTGNEIEENHSNVLKFFKCLQLDEEQVAYYDPGVGTIAREGAWSRWRAKAKGVFGLLTGHGLDENVLDAYRFLVREYREGDEIWMIGYSRGAYTVRVLAGLIHMVGLARSANENLLPQLLTAYKRASETDDFRHAWRFEEMLRTRRVTIRFLGCWDTVASMIVPRRDRFHLPAMDAVLPYTVANAGVQCFRHAMAIDERRRMYRLMPWVEGQLFKTNPFQSDENAVPQDCRQVWFSGVHADIGGGYAETRSGPAKYPLAWMIDEAREQGLRFREVLVGRVVEGKNPAGSRRQYSAASPEAALHNSLAGFWHVLEWIPKRVRFREWPARRARWGWYLPRAEPRPLPTGSLVHSSVSERVAALPSYRPENLEGHVVFPPG